MALKFRKTGKPASHGTSSQTPDTADKWRLYFGLTPGVPVVRVVKKAAEAPESLDTAAENRAD